MSATPSTGPSAATVANIAEKAKLLSSYSMMSTTAAGSGHPTSCMSAAQLVAGVYFYAMKFDPKNANLAAVGQRPKRSVSGPDTGAGVGLHADGSGR